MKFKVCALLASVLLAAGAQVASAAVVPVEVAGHNGPIVLEVTVDNGKVSAIKVIKSEETEGLGAEVLKNMPAKIIEANSTKVDNTAGATVTSEALKLAVKTALARASGAAEAKAEYKPGTYNGKAYGSNGYIEVSVTVEPDKITKVEVGPNSETKFMGGMAMERLSKDIVDYQTLNVDNVSGATVTCSAFKQAVGDALRQSGVNFAALQKPVPPKVQKKDGIEEATYDLVIVGSGGAGLSAAVTAAEGGCKNVVVIEKMPVVGGNTLRCASAFNAADPELQKALPMTDTLKDAVVKALNEPPANDEHKKLIEDVKKDYEAYLATGSTTLFDSPNWHALQTYNGGDKVGRIPVIRKYAENVLATLHWMKDHGSPVNPRISQGAGALWQRTHQIDAPGGTGLIEPLYDAAMKNGVKIITEMRAGELIVKDGKVVGVVANDKAGNVYHFNSNNGVILATGGYSQNKELRQKSSPVLTPDMASTNQPGATGDGLKMATSIGADTTGMNYVQVYPLATPGSGTLQGRARKMSGLDDVIDVNKNGERFVKEDARRDEFVAAIKQQPGAMCYDINDSSIVQPTNSFAENVEVLISLGRIYKADTLADLAKQLGMPPENLEKTVAEFNKMVEDKNDPKFGRKLFDQKIEKPPFYATPRAPSIHHTMGGLSINPNAQVLDKDNKPIPGLYAAGEVAGGVHGSNRLGANAVPDVLTYGRIAAKSALNLK